MFVGYNFNIPSVLAAKFEWNDEKLYSQIQDLKKTNPELKTLLAVGGWNHESFSSPFSQMVATEAKRKVSLSLLVSWLCMLCSVVF